LGTRFVWLLTSAFAETLLFVGLQIDSRPSRARSGSNSELFNGKKAPTMAVLRLLAGGV
jgi:hypothetical protein